MTSSLFALIVIQGMGTSTEQSVMFPPSHVSIKPEAKHHVCSTENRRNKSRGMWLIDFLHSLPVCCDKSCCREKRLRQNVELCFVRVPKPKFPSSHGLHHWFLKLNFFFISKWRTLSEKKKQILVRALRITGMCYFKLLCH